MKKLIAIISPGSISSKFTRSLLRDGWIRLQPSVFTKHGNLGIEAVNMKKNLPCAANVYVFETDGSQCVSGPNFPRVESKLADAKLTSGTGESAA